MKRWKVAKGHCGQKLRSMRRQNKICEKESQAWYCHVRIYCTGENLGADIIPRRPSRVIEISAIVPRNFSQWRTSIDTHLLGGEGYTGLPPPPTEVSMQHATPASSISETCYYLIFLNMSSGSIYPFGAVNSGNLGGGLLILVIGSTLSGGDLTGVSSPPPASIPFAIGVTCASKFNVPELLRLQNSLVYFLFIVSGRLSGCGIDWRVSDSLISESWPLGIGLITLLGDFSSPDLWVPPFLFQKLMPGVLLRLSPKIEAKLGVLGREDSP